MTKNTEEDFTENLRQSIIEAKSKKQKEKYCVRDFEGEVFELTSDMCVNEHKFDKEEQNEFAGIAECILRKYSKLLTMAK